MANNLFQSTSTFGLNYYHSYQPHSSLTVFPRISQLKRCFKNEKLDDIIPIPKTIWGFTHFMAGPITSPELSSLSSLSSL